MKNEDHLFAEIIPLQENQDYAIIPDHQDDQQWNIRVLDGPYTEVVFRFGAVTLDGINDAMRYSIEIVEQPGTPLCEDEDLLNDRGFQDYCASVLMAVIERAQLDQALNMEQLDSDEQLIISDDVNEDSIE